MSDTIAKLENQLTSIIEKINMIEKLLISPYYRIKKVPNIYENFTLEDEQ